jgi:hypothetical protein
MSPPERSRCTLAHLLEAVEDEVVVHIRQMAGEGWDADTAGDALVGYLASVGRAAVDRAVAEMVWERS